jgi:hypothetical protein
MLGQPALCQTWNDPNEGLRIKSSTANPGGYELSWFGRSGRSYFVLQSDDDMASWVNVPLMEAGAGTVIQWGLDSSAFRLFFKLQWFDGYDTGTAGQTDSDMDGVSDLDELLVGTNPFGTPPVQPPPQDTDQDGVTDDLDMVPYDSFFKAPPSMSPMRYALIDLGVGASPRMGTNGHMYWSRYLIGDMASWPNKNGQLVTFSTANLLGSTYASHTFADISPEGDICGVASDNLLRPCGLQYTPGLGLVVYEPYGASYGTLTGQPRWGPGDQVYGYLAWGTRGNPYSVGFNGIGVFSNNYQPLRVVDTDDQPAYIPTPNPPPLPGETLRYFAGAAAWRVASNSSAISRGGIIETVYESTAPTFDVFYLDELFAPASYREYGPYTSSTQQCLLRTAAGQVIDLGTRDLLTDAMVEFTSVSTHQPMPWLSGPSPVPDPAWMGYSLASHIWLPNDGSYAAHPIYACRSKRDAAVALDYIYQLNSQGMALVEGTMRDGSYDFGLWSNGEATALPDLIDETDWDHYQASSWTMYGLSDGGMIAAKATKLSDNAPHILALIPGEPVAGELGTNREQKNAWLMTEARPKPEVKLYITGTQMTTTGVQVSLRGTVYDELSSFAKTSGDRVTNLNFSVYGQALGSVSLSSAVGQGQTFQFTAVIPHARAMSYTIRAETSANKAGEKGLDEVAVSVGYVGSFSSSSTATQMHVSFGTAPTNTSVDTASVYFGSSSGSAIVTETGAATGEFVGSATHPSGTVPCTMQLRLPSSLDTALPDTLDGMAELTLPTGPSQIACSLVETGANTRVFSVPVGTQLFDAGSLKVVTTSNLSGEQAEKGLNPFTIRIGAVPGLAASGATVNVNGTAFPLKEFTQDGKTALYPVDPANPDEPRRFLPATGAVPQHLSIPGYTSSSETQTLDFKLNYLGQQSSIATVQVQPATIEGYAGEPEPTSASTTGWKKPGDKVTMADLMTAFKILYGNEGQNLLYYFEQGDGVIQLGDVLGDLDIDVLTLDQKTYIQIEDDDVEVAGSKYNPGVAAQLLWNGLNQCLAYHHIRVNIPATDLNALIQSRQAVSQQAAEIGIATSELYLAGVGIACPGVDLILTINDVAEGHYLALAAALHFIPRSIFTNGGRVLLKNTGGQVVDAIQDANALVALQSIKRGKWQTTLGGVLDEHSWGEAIRKVLTSSGGPIDPPTWHGQLAYRMHQLVPRPSSNYRAHHDLVWAQRVWFARHGIDVNEVAFGRWIDKETHDRWHYQMTPTFNDFWKNFISGENPLEPLTKQQILEKMAEARATFSIINP